MKTIIIFIKSSQRYLPLYLPGCSSKQSNIVFGRTLVGNTNVLVNSLFKGRYICFMGNEIKQIC